MGLTSHHTWKLPTLQGAYVHHALCPEPYRSPLGGTPEEIATASAADIGELIRYSTPGRIAAFLAEPIQGVGGVTTAAPNYFREAYRIAREHGGLCIADDARVAARPARAADAAAPRRPRRRRHRGAGRARAPLLQADRRGSVPVRGGRGRQPSQRELVAEPVEL